MTPHVQGLLDDWSKHPLGTADADKSERENGSNNTIFWDPGRDPVSSAAATNVHLVAAELVRAVAAGEHES